MTYITKSKRDDHFDCKNLDSKIGNLERMFIKKKAKNS